MSLEMSDDEAEDELKSGYNGQGDWLHVIVRDTVSV